MQEISNELLALLTRTRTVLFDMDDVLCHLDDAHRIQYLHELSGMRHNDIEYAIWGSGFEDRADAGEFSAEEYLVEFGNRIDHPISREEWCAYRMSGMTPIPEMLAFAEGLRDTHKLGVLTNNGHILVEQIDVLFPELRPIFGENIFCSAQFKCRKPMSEIYLGVCAKLGSSPVETLFIDDRVENVTGAIEAGLKGHVFSIEQIRK